MGAIWDRKTGKQIGFVKDDGNVYNVDHPPQKIATLRGSDLYSLSGDFLGMHLDNLYSENTDLRDTDNDANAIARFKKLKGKDV